MELELLNSALLIFFKRFQDNLYDYLYEFDIHAELLVHLKKYLCDLKFNFPLKYGENEEKQCAFSLVRSLYPIDNNKIDIVILNKDNFTIENFKENDNPLYKEEVDIGIEIKFNAFNSEQSFIDDINKLSFLLSEKKVKIGISILFSHYEIDYEDYPRIIKMKPRVVNIIFNKSELIEENKVNSFIITPKEIKYRVFD